SLGGDIDIACNVRIRWHKIVFAFQLQSVAAEIDESHRIRASRRYLGDEIPERAPQRILIKVANADHIETGGLKRLRDQSGIVGRRRKGSRRIIRVADDQSEARLRRLGTNRGQPSEKKHREQGQYETALMLHDKPGRRNLMENIKA